MVVVVVVEKRQELILKLQVLLSTRGGLRCNLYTMILMCGLITPPKLKTQANLHMEVVAKGKYQHCRIK